MSPAQEYLAERITNAINNAIDEWEDLDNTEIVQVLLSHLNWQLNLTDDGGICDDDEDELEAEEDDEDDEDETDTAW